MKSGNTPINTENKWILPEGWEWIEGMGKMDDGVADTGLQLWSKSQGKRIKA